MNYRIFTLLLSILLFNSISFAQSRSSQSSSSASVADPIAFEKARFSQLNIDGKRWIKATIKGRCKGDPEAKTSGGDVDWLKNVEITLTAAFDGKDKQMYWFSADATFHALEKNKEYYFYFYIPWDIARMYEIVKYDPKGYIIDLKANGNNYPIGNANYKSRSNLTSSSIVSFMEQASARGGDNKGIMCYFDDAPFLVQYNDTPNGATHPTSLKK